MKVAVARLGPAEPRVLLRREALAVVLVVIVMLMVEIMIMNGVIVMMMVARRIIMMVMMIGVGIALEDLDAQNSGRTRRDNPVKHEEQGRDELDQGFGHRWGLSGDRGRRLESIWPAYCGGCLK